MIVRDKFSNDITFVCNQIPAAKTVYLAGDFNQWNPEAKKMLKNRDGSFRIKTRLTPGEHQYKFVADGIWLNDSEAEHQVENPFGTLNSVVTVS